MASFLENSDFRQYLPNLAPPGISGSTAREICSISTRSVTPSTRLQRPQVYGEVYSAVQLWPVLEPILSFSGTCSTHCTN